MFREIHEIKKEEDERRETLGYLRIKPTRNITEDEADNFIMEMFMKAAAEAARGEV